MLLIHVVVLLLSRHSRDAQIHENWLLSTSVIPFKYVALYIRCVFSFNDMTFNQSDLAIVPTEPVPLNLDLLESSRLTIWVKHS